MPQRVAALWRVDRRDAMAPKRLRHAPHGGADAQPAYRNLRSDAGNNMPGRGLVTYNDTPGVNDLTRDVFVRRALGYDETDVDFNEPDPKVD